MSRYLNLVIMASVLSASASSWAAIALDRTRAIIPGNEKSISLTISNENKEKPYLAQAWLEDKNGKKISTPFMVTPPVQRVEPGKKSMVRINALPEAASLPQDRESVYWLSVREVPPKSERPNVLQVALQTRIKLYYRPAAILPERFTRWDDQLILHRVSNGFRIENPTPFYMTVISISGAAKKIDHDFKPIMIAPKSSETVKALSTSTPFVTTINDFGGKPTLEYRCSGDICKGILPDSKA
ncbi:molecular chaperone [Enterobacter cancerogenus]|uniref:fimbrial biogenesis chaperone n=1 Tax=Enterobacter cancerogenus TaxID=69218 RepID=UPI000C9A6BD1|nr:fimbria/pilus periplasmic chaperone [Enterobacter cancerogenus]PNF13476.1 molecular chaperone [Enterobacter cancerogenus]